MSRTTKNILTGSILLILISASMLTMYFAGKSVATNNNFNPSSNQMMPQEAPSGNNGGQPDGNMPQGSPPTSTPPEKPSGEGENDNSTEKKTPPSNNNGGQTENTDNNGEENKPSDMPSSPPDNNGMTPPDGDFSSINQNQSFSIYYYIIFGIESTLIGLLLMYWLLSNFHKKSFKETFQDKDKIVILFLATVLITGGLTYLDTIVSKNVFQETNTNANNINAKGKTTVTTSQTLNSNYKSTTSDESAILVKDGGLATITDATINKESGDSTNTENSEFYGVNAGILVQKESTASIKNTTIKTSAKGSNAVFATGDNSRITISDSTIETTGESSARGLDATYGGEIVADNVTIKTQGGSCATLATDRGEGTITVKKSKLETNGSGSPLIYSTGNITVKNTTGDANGSQIAVIEGKNSATIKNSQLTASGKGNRKDVDQAGIMIYQSMSGDASEGVGTLNATDSSLTIQKNSEVYNTAPMFFVTNTTAVINLTNTKLSYGSNILLKSSATSEWGNENNNGGNVTLNATNQALEGNIEADKISTVTLNLKESSALTGTINKENTAKEIHVKLDKTSKLTLTGDSYITSLENEDESYSNIDFNGYTLYVNGTAIH